MLSNLIQLTRRADKAASGAPIVESVPQITLTGPGGVAGVPRETRTRSIGSVLVGIAVALIATPLVMAMACLAVGVLARAWHWMALGMGG